MRISTRIQSLLVSAALLVPRVATPVTAAYAQPTEEKTAASWSGVVINEAYLSGGSKGAAYKNKFIELYNTTDNDVTLDGTSLQYRPASGTGASNAAADLTGVIKAKGHYLIKAGSNGSDGAERTPPPPTSTPAAPKARCSSPPRQASSARPSATPRRTPTSSTRSATATPTRSRRRLPPRRRTTPP